MNVLLVTSIYLPHIGGIELYVKNLAVHLLKRNCNVTIFVGDRFVKSFSEKFEGNIKIIRCPVFYIKGMTYLKNKYQYYILKQELSKADIVHLNDIKFLYKYLAVNKKYFSYKLFFSSHGFIFHTKSFAFLKKIYMCYMQKYSSSYDINYCVSDSDYSIAEKFKFHNIKKLIPGVDINKFKSLDTGNAIVNNFLYWGRISRNKGVLRLVELFNNLDFDYTLNLIGVCDDEILLKNINSIISENSKINLLGYKDDTELEKYIQEAEFLLFPSLYEGFGMSLIEGISSGKKIIANTIPTYKEILSQCNMLVNLFDFSNDADSLLATIKNLKTIGMVVPNLYNFSIEYMVDIIYYDYLKHKG